MVVIWKSEYQLWRHPSKIDVRLKTDFLDPTLRCPTAFGEGTPPPLPPTVHERPNRIAHNINARIRRKHGLGKGVFETHNTFFVRFWLRLLIISRPIGDTILINYKKSFIRENYSTSEMQNILRFAYLFMMKHFSAV